MKKIFLFMNGARHPLLKILVLFVLCEIVFIGNFGFANTGNQGNNTTKTSPPPNSLAWQLEELTKWLIQSRHQTLNGKTTESPFYVLNSLKLTGSVEKNRLSFRKKDYYFVRTKEKDFTINGEISLITILPLILIWLFSWGYVGFCNRQKTNRVLEQIKKIWKSGGIKLV